MLLQFGIPSGFDPWLDLVSSVGIGVLAAVAAWLLAGRRDPDHRLAWTAGAGVAGFGSLLGAVAVLLLLPAVTDGRSRGGGV